MERKIILKILCLAIILITFLTNTIYANTSEKGENNIEIKYEYDENTNQVTAKIISDIELKDTKPTWQLSSDKKTYIKVYSKNEKYNTEVIDINGNSTILEVNIYQIKELTIKMEYDYNKLTGQVVAQMISNIELKDTKPTWELSEDKLVYTKVFTENMIYQTPVEDKYGNVMEVTINIDQIGKEKPIIQVFNDYDNTTNQVVCKMVSDVPLKDTKPTWKLSEDQIAYTKTFTSNMDYTTPVEDIYGNIINVNIKITKIDEMPPEITLEYKYNSDDTVTVYMKSNEKMGDTKPTWKLSTDKLTYEKIYDSDQTYNTLVTDIYGNGTSVKIDFKTKKFIYNQEDNSTIKVRYLYADRKKATVEIISSIPMNPTKPTWKLSEDGYTYTKEYYANEMYKTYIQDINGVTKEVSIMVNLFDNYLLGIDVSHHQGVINWAEVKNSGIDFAIIRVGYGQNFTSQDDKYFERNISECERLGIPYGVYLYSYAVNVENASSEADHVLRLIKGHNPTYGIWYDLEEDNENVNYINIATTFCEKIKANGYNQVGIYANLEWWNKKLNDSSLDKYDKWVAQWGNSCTYNKPYKMWQYTENGSVNGIKGNVDMDILYK